MYYFVISIVPFRSMKKTCSKCSSIASYVGKSLRDSPNAHHLIRPFSFSSSINTKSKYCLILILCVFCRFASKAVAYAIEENTSCFFVYTSLLSMYKHRACKHIVISADGIDKNNLRIQYIHYMYIPFLIFFFALGEFKLINCLNDEMREEY